MNKKAPNLGQLDQLSTTLVENHWNQTKTITWQLHLLFNYIYF